jgi:hypothetical protein
MMRYGFFGVVVGILRRALRWQSQVGLSANSRNERHGTTMKNQNDR